MIDKIEKADGRRVGLRHGRRAAGGTSLPKPGGSLVRAAAVVVFLVYLPFLELLPFAYIRTDLTDGGTDWASVLFIIAVYMIVAVGLNVVIGLAGLLDLGYVGFYAIGAYSVALFGSPSSPVTKWIAEQVRPLRGVGGRVRGLHPDRDRADHDLRRDPRCADAAPARGLPRHRDHGLRRDHPDHRCATRPVDRRSRRASAASRSPPGRSRPTGGRSSTSLEIYRWYWLALAVAVILIWAVRRLENSRVGRSWLAIREDEDAAGIMGVAAFKFKLWAFAIGAALGGIAGLLFASRQAYIEPNELPAEPVVPVRGHGGHRGVRQHRSARSSVRSCSPTCPNGSASSRSGDPFAFGLAHGAWSWCCVRRAWCRTEDGPESSRTDEQEAEEASADV